MTQKAENSYVKRGTFQIFATAFVLSGFFPTVRADPPAATIARKVLVPSGLGAAPFDSDRSLTIPPGFEISVWARLPGARFLAVAPNGDVFVSQPSAGSVIIFRPNPGGGAPAMFVYTSSLRQPHGLAFDQQNGSTWLYIAESHQIDRFLYQAGDTVAPRGQLIVPDLPDNAPGGYAHPLKSVAIGPDHSLYVAIGSSCNACAGDAQAIPERAAIWKYDADGTGGRLFAAGLRNPEGLAFLPGTAQLWAAVNNRDELPYPFHDSSGQYGQVVHSWVDNHPPDLFTSVRDGGNYGWPFCNSDPDSASGLNLMPFDADPENNSDGHVSCAAMDRVTKGIQAHSAPLGVAFLQGTMFAGPWRQGAVLAYHGSWDRTSPTGYKVTYFPWDSIKQAPGTEADLITGFFGWGRPVAAAALPDGSLLVTDDMAGAVYRLRWAPSAVSAANGYPVIAPASYAAVYGSGLVSQTVSAVSPYPESLGGISLTVTDSNGQTLPAPLIYVSPSQINFLVPNGLSSGTAHLTLNTGSAGTGSSAPSGIWELRKSEPWHRRCSVWMAAAQAMRRRSL